MALTWEISKLELPLAYNWKISRNESTHKTNLIVKVIDNGKVGIGEVAPNIRYGESVESIFQKFALLIDNLSLIKSLEELLLVIDNQPLDNSLRFGIESAYIHLLSIQKDIPVYAFLGLNKPRELFTSYTLPIMDVSEVNVFINKYNLKRFKYLKIKINQESAFEFIEEVSKSIPEKILRIDANEAWTNVDNLLTFMEKCKPFRIEFFEQPLPSYMHQEYTYLKKRSPYLLIADESVTNTMDIETISSGFHGVNMKLMKAGGYLKGVKILQDAKNKGLKTMIGCMVETSLGIFSAINLCNDINYIDLDGHFLIENEPFKLVSEKDGRLEIVT